MRPDHGDTNPTGCSNSTNPRTHVLFQQCSTFCPESQPAQIDWFMGQHCSVISWSGLTITVESDPTNSAHRNFIILPFAAAQLCAQAHSQLLFFPLNLLAGMEHFINLRIVPGSHHPVWCPSAPLWRLQNRARWSPLQMCRKKSASSRTKLCNFLNYLRQHCHSAKGGEGVQTGSSIMKYWLVGKCAERFFFAIFYERREDAIR